jgi:hypothetical protein
MFGTVKKFVPDNPNIKVPFDKEHFPYALDEEDMFKLQKIKQDTFKRHEKSEPEDFGDAIKIPSQYYQWYYITRVKAFNEPKINVSLFKNMMYGHTTIYRPDHHYKELAFEATSPDDLYKDKILENNEYVTDPLGGDLNVDLPNYAAKYFNQVNVTADRMELLSEEINFKITISQFFN